MRAQDKTKDLAVEDNLKDVLVDSSFEEDVIGHVEGALTNNTRNVTPFPYQRDGVNKMSTKYWGKLMLQAQEWTDDVFRPDDSSLFDDVVTEKF